MDNRCYQMAKNLLQKKGYKRYNISVVECAGDFFVETPKVKKEINAHCKWCAVFDVVAGES